MFIRMKIIFKIYMCFKNGFLRWGVDLEMITCAVLKLSMRSIREGHLNVGEVYDVQHMWQIGKFCRNVLQYIAIARLKSSPIFAPHLAFAGTYANYDSPKKNTFTRAGWCVWNPNRFSVFGDQVLF